MQQFQVFFSNQVEKLYEQLKQNLFNSTTSPFERRLVIVPSPAMKSWLMLRMAQDPDLGIAAGMEIAYLDDSISKLLNDYSETPQLMTPLEMAFAIEWEIREAVVKGGDEWEPIRRYFGLKSDESLTARNQRRLVALSTSLASLFQRYAKYGNGMVEGWDKGTEKGWQQDLWRRIYKDRSYLYRALKSKLKIPQECRLSIHLFSLSFLPRVYHEFLTKLAKQVPVNYYMLSPCEVFWSDIKSDKERIHLQKFLKANQKQLDQLDDYLKDCNPLLANFGRLGREMAQQLEEGDVQTHEDYHTDEKTTLLKTIQSDLLTLQYPEAVSHVDKTIQVHTAPTPLREIEVLQDLLLGLFDKHSKDDEPITPRDVIVMAPDIMKYEPFIKMVFQPPQGVIDVQIMDLKMPAQSPMVQSFMLFLDLPSSRWEGAKVLQFLEQPSVRKKQGWGLEELVYLRTWVEKSGIRWGLDAPHRSEIVSNLHDRNAQFDTFGTWKFGLSRLMRSLVLEDENEIEIDLPQSEFLGTLSVFLEDLKKDTAPFIDGQFLSLKEWSEKLKELFQKYFFEYESEDEVKLLLRLFAQIAKAGRELPDAKYPFISVKRHLLEALTSQSTSYRESQLNAVRFCSLLPMRAIPAKVVVLLGMEEGAFPRQEPHFSLDLLKTHPDADYCPSQTDFDRYLFLEALISARQYFIMSYTNHFKEKSASLVVSELLNYLNCDCLYQHPFKSFDKGYFEAESDFRSYSKERYGEACAFYKVQKNEDHQFIPHFSIKNKMELPKQLFLTIGELSSAISNPLKIYFTKGLGFYIERDKEEKVDLKLTMNHLEKYRLVSDSFKMDPEKLLNEFHKQGKLPEGPFLQRTKDELLEELNELHEDLKGIQIITIEMSSHYEKASFDKGVWKLPPLKINYEGSVVDITGTIEAVSNEGLLVNGKFDFKKQFKEIARAIVLLNLVKQFDLNVKPQLIFIKDRKKVILPNLDPEHMLAQLLDFYFQVKVNPSPLLPEWIEEILKDSGDDLVDQIESREKSDFQRSFNEYSSWIMRGTGLPQRNKLIDDWSLPLENLFTPFYVKPEKGKK